MHNPEPCDTWLITTTGWDIAEGQHQDFYRGQVLEFALRAFTVFSTPSDEHEVRHLLRADDTYDVNARILCVTRFDGDQEPDAFLSIIDFGTKAYSFEQFHDGVLDSGNYWASAKIWLSPSWFGSQGYTVYPYATELIRKWRIENIYKCPPETEPRPLALQEVSEFRLAGPDPDGEDFLATIAKLTTLRLRCKDLGPARAGPPIDA